VNKGRYGYHRVTLELKNQGFNINHKKVQRLMKKFNLQSIIRKKRKYSSYKGRIGKIADNHIKRNFEATAPNQKWFTDVTLKEKKITQSMSRKGNSLDNGLMECFFGLLKLEMFYEQEEKYKTLEELKEAIEDYIYYYNNKRIKEKLKGLTPASYRSQSLLVS